MTLHVATPLLQDYAYLATRMSEEERVQYLSATGEGEFDADVAARQFAATPGMQWLLVDEDFMPVSIFGCFPVAPGVQQTWMVTRDGGFESHGREISEIARDTLVAALQQSDIRRIQTFARADRERAHRWYERWLGMKREGVLRKFYGDVDAVVYSRVED